MSIIVNGKKIAQDVEQEILKTLEKYEVRPQFDIVYVGSDPVIDSFVKFKQRFGARLGVDVLVHRFDDDIDEESLVHIIENLADSSDAMIVQLPLPDHLDQQTIVGTIPSDLDVDVLGAQTRMLFSENETDFIPPVPASILQVLESHNVSLHGKNIVLIGHGSLVGYPMGLWFTREGYAFDVITEDTPSAMRQSLLQDANIIISGAGHPDLVTPEMISSGVVLIDAGTSESGKKIVGDINSECKEKASLYTPVPGGIGPITIAMLYRNIINEFVKKLC